MVLYLVGLGLGDEDDITVKGLKIVQQCDRVVLEAYTSVLGNVGPDPHDPSGPCRTCLYGRTDIVVADRELVESATACAEHILAPARGAGTVAFLVVGDPVCATTHTDLLLRARDMGIAVEIIHNASIMGAVGSCGLQLYNFGQTVSIPFFDEQWRPLSFYPKIDYNRRGGMHTLCLLDIKVKEPDYDAFLKNGGRGKPTYLPPRYMTVAQAAMQLLEAEGKMGKGAYHGSRTLCVGLARMGKFQTTTTTIAATTTEEDTSSTEDRRALTIPPQKIVAGTLQELALYDDIKMGPPLHSFIICGHLHDLEMDVLRGYLIDGSTYDIGDHSPLKDLESLPE